ncbi:MAG TPA: metalloendopeptidase [Desulfosporosinus sp.]|jgi:murein DD-endopeptidase MepM/ murein hydrolase activator NlpD|nr:metalloendopeptidase [Desulfosporosinus sp.]
MKVPSMMKRRLLTQLVFLIFVGIIAWQAIHRPPTILSDVYPYLTSLSPTLVKQCIHDNQASQTIVFEELLAIRSTLPDGEAQPLLDQLKNSVPFSKLNWGTIPQTSKNNVLRHREILNKYTYYRPDQYRYPVIGTTWFGDSFGADREGGKRRHEGTDLFGKEGTPIVSICGGEVEQLGWNRLGGERVGIRGDDGNYYYYAHLQTISTSLIKGKRVKPGEFLGTMGHTGVALTTPDHLHFGIELPNGQWINPYAFLEVWKYSYDQL